MFYTTYILYSSCYNRYYIGHTNNLKFRLRQHNEYKSSWTKSYRPWIVIYQKNHKIRAAAMKEEKYLKSLKNKKRIEEYIAGWRSSIPLEAEPINKRKN